MEAEHRLRAGHPWLYADSIRKQNRPGQVGEVAVVYDQRNRFFTLGLFDPESPIRVRVLRVRNRELVNREWWSSRFQQALERRRGLFSEQTTGFRCINGESDGWPGLVLDRYGQTLVLKLYTAVWLPRLDEVTGLLAEALRPERLVVRLSRNIQDAARNQFGKADGDVLLGAAPGGPVVFLESGLRFEADVLRGQKTGFFLDQRENRRKVETLARGRSVLNAFSFSGGFSLYAARGGAAAVADLDISEHALAGARRNFALNHSLPAVASCKHETIQADAFDWLAENPRRSFGLVILDPPSLARREAERAGAIRAYTKLAAFGLEHMVPGGYLVACSCSAHVTAEEFFAAVRLAATQAGRKVEELTTMHHPPDHPATFREAEYLKAIYFRTVC